MVLSPEDTMTTDIDTADFQPEVVDTLRAREERRQRERVIPRAVPPPIVTPSPRAPPVIPPAHVPVTPVDSQKPRTDSLLSASGAPSVALRGIRRWPSELRGRPY
jgi:hypothetical protein